MARDKEAWLAVFADDAIVEDPIGPSHFDPRGQGPPRQGCDREVLRHGDSPSTLTFNFEKTYQCGNEEANVGHIVIESSGYRVIAEGGVFTYRVNDDGKNRCATGLLGARQSHGERAEDLGRHPPG